MNPSKTVKYIDNKIDENLYWKQHIHDITIKLNTVNALLFTIRIYVNKHILRIIYLAIFYSQINYAYLTWCQNLNVVN